MKAIEILYLEKPNAKVYKCKVGPTHYFRVEKNGEQFIRKGMPAVKDLLRDKPKRTISEAHRKAIIEAQKKRWAEKKAKPLF